MWYYLPVVTFQEKNDYLIFRQYSTRKVFSSKQCSPMLKRQSELVSFKEISAMSVNGSVNKIWVISLHGVRMQLSIFKFSKNSQNSHHGPESLTAAQHGTSLSVSELVSQVTGRPKPLEQDPQAQIENTAVGWINFLPSHFTHVVTFDG